ncbi:MULTISPECIES: Arc family DNA-binding protein [unclassified Paraburkholderia]|uniref:Arc family DNA-binding protein n=1 Tax=unclassified Paraburkholderia TaxID=2615204 RepID=UPI00161C1DDB|nr:MULTISPECIES: Arc family DNA-binding protein [unclassified Paraburkholderia]MBB5444665.1 hypothetical protein [Paraburkholderia sp. WSM4177]MBB5485490.1 hypothetical protein [Paraburkholderia sp. WSM4180]
MSRDDHQMKIRLPAELKDSIEGAAAANKRSLNAEIVARLEQSFSDLLTHLSNRHLQQIEQYATARKVTFDDALHMLINAGLHPDAPLVVALHLENGTEVSKLHEALDAVMGRVPKKAIVSVEMPSKRKTKKDTP